ncbi:FliH/SctL family protein [Pectinatus frisingensis]|uniref:FliH/SctL family protein n=1 Tax=Pectinatus frisingensis TaxID=865 RepID=UPI0018C6CBBD|nr:FliH/SctL family protein [Pectinatus frisingensis]
MYKVIKSAVMKTEPYVVKTSELIAAASPDNNVVDVNDKSAITEKPDITDNVQTDIDKLRQKKITLQTELKRLTDAIADKQTSLADLQKKADLIVKNAQEKSDSILQKAEADCTEKLQAADNEVEKIKQTARQSGHDEGYQKGLDDSKVQAQQTVKTADDKAIRVVSNAEQQVQEYFGTVENDLVDLVMEVAGKIIPQQFTDMPQLILPIVQSALAKVKNQTTIEIRVSANSYEFASAAKSELQNVLSGNVRLSIKTDESLSDGDCWIETPDGSIDARLLSQLNEIKKSLKEVLGKHETGNR